MTRQPTLVSLLARNRLRNPKPGAKGRRQQDNNVTFQEKKTLIRAALGQRTGRGEFHFLDRWQQAAVITLRLGHNRRNAHIFRKMKLAPLPACNFGLEDQTAEHILQRCPLLQTARKKCMANSSPATHQTLQHQGGTQEEGHIHLIDRTLSAAAVKKKKKKKYCSKADSSAILRYFFSAHHEADPRPSPRSSPICYLTPPPTARFPAVIVMQMVGDVNRRSDSLSSVLRSIT